ncbi:MAG: type II toxin-antitoxin system VapC family toxin [Caulobacterales bacterium]
MVDSSAIVAIRFGEPLAGVLFERLKADSAPIMSVANYVETGQVLAQRRPGSPAAALDRFHELLSRAGIVLAPIDEVQARVALEARIRYGRGFGHRARLNYSDCFAYALAKVRGAPLLFVGDDFTHTDIVSALAELPR